MKVQQELDETKIVLVRDAFSLYRIFEGGVPPSSFDTLQYPNVLTLAYHTMYSTRQLNPFWSEARN